MPRVHVPAVIVRRVRASARHRCGYCLSPQQFVMARLTIGHIIPLAEGGGNDEDNLWLSCPICNGHKADKVIGVDPITSNTVALFNPRSQVWSEHFEWIERGLLIRGLTPVGRATVDALHLNDDPIRLDVRSAWIQVGWHPPKD